MGRTAYFLWPMSGKIGFRRIPIRGQETIPFRLAIASATSALDISWRVRPRSRAAWLLPPFFPRPPLGVSETCASCARFSESSAWRRAPGAQMLGCSRRSGDL